MAYKRLQGETEKDFKARTTLQRRYHYELRDYRTHAGEGLKVTLSRSRFTRRGLLAVPFRFQVPPLDEFTVGHSFNWSDYETISAGQFSRPGGRQLRTVSFQTMFADYRSMYWTLLDYPPGTSLPTPLDWTFELQAILESGTPFKLVVGQPEHWHDNDLDMLATLRTMDVTERGGEPDARYVSMGFTEWRDLAVTRKRKGKGRGGGPPGLLPKGEAALEDLVHTIKQGDTLQKLSRRYYGSTSRRYYKHIMANNSGLRSWPGSKNLYLFKRNGRRVRAILIPMLPSP